MNTKSVVSSSQTHSIIGIGRDHCRSSPTTAKVGSLQQVTQERQKWVLSISKGDSSLGSLFQAALSPLQKIIFPQMELPVVQFVLIASSCSPETLKRAWCHPLNTCSLAIYSLCSSLQSVQVSLKGSTAFRCVSQSSQLCIISKFYSNVYSNENKWHNECI